jgi:hypothetical protein
MHRRNVFLMRFAVFTKRLCILGVALIPVVGCMSTHAESEAASASPAGFETVTRTLHPAGPSVRHEWRFTANGPVQRIQLERARAGQIVLGQARLVRNPYGNWAIVQGDGQVRPLSTSGAPQTFSDSGNLWEVRVSAEEIPVQRPGIATEAEPALNLTLELKN